MSSKVDNLEAVVKNLKFENKNIISEKVRISKENMKIQKQLYKLRERKQAESKSTTTIPVISSEASTSTAMILTTVGSSNTPVVIKCSQITQISDQIDIPYDIEAPLPPLFNSCPVHTTKPVNFFSRSHPNLSQIYWTEATEEDILEDEIQEMEMKQYDSEVKEFYHNSREKAKALREVYDDALIEKLF